MEASGNNTRRRRYKQYALSENVSTRTRQRWNKIKVVSGSAPVESESLQNTGEYLESALSKDSSSEGNYELADNLSSNTSASSTDNSDTESNQVGLEKQEEELFNTCHEHGCESQAEIHSHSDNKQNKDFVDVIFPQSGITKQSVLTMIYGLCLKQHLTNEARKDILEVVKVCTGMEDDETFSTSNYTMSKCFDPPDECFLGFQIRLF